MEILTVKDVSAYLNINEKKIYQLVKDGEIPYTRIGGKIVFAREIIDRWLREGTVREADILVAGSDDPLLKDVIELFNRQTEHKAFYATVGSLNGLKLLGAGRADACCAHILDLEGKHNVSYLDRYLNRAEYVVIRLFSREQGVLLPRDNPHRIKRFTDVFERNLRFVTRNSGTGTRIIIDYLQQKEGLRLAGDAFPEVTSHLSAGMKVLLGEADASFGIRYIAEMLNLHFLPLMNEPFDMILSANAWEGKAVRDFVDFFDQANFLRHFPKAAGYDVSAMGNMVWRPNQSAAEARI